MDGRPASADPDGDPDFGAARPARALVLESRGLELGAGWSRRPPTPTLRDLLVGIGAVQMPFGLDGVVARVAREMSPEVAAVVESTLGQLLAFRTERVQAVALWPVVMQ